MDMLKNNNEGFLYPYTEPTMLAEYVSKYFEDDKLCLEYGKNAKNTASKRHNSQKNLEEMKRIHQEILKGE